MLDGVIRFYLVGSIAYGLICSLAIAIAGIHVSRERAEEVGDAKWILVTATLVGVSLACAVWPISVYFAVLRLLKEDIDVKDH